MRFNFFQKDKQLPDQKEVIFEWKNDVKEVIDKRWQIGISIFLIICFVFFIMDKNYWGAGMVIVISFLIFLFPYYQKEQSFAILKNGIKIGNEVFPWDYLESFWIIEEEPFEIYIKHKRKFPGNIILPFDKKDVNKIKHILSGYLPEQEIKRNFIDKVFRKIGL
ncbi:MAG TPA: DUF5673 domain-containing protein [Candidatus Paceibacterota bacterium]|nr:DUF5673 domain-containing protein [Candidatus Paceibacterota bacterium]